VDWHAAGRASDDAALTSGAFGTFGAHFALLFAGGWGGEVGEIPWSYLGEK